MKIQVGSKAWYDQMAKDLNKVCYEMRELYPIGKMQNRLTDGFYAYWWIGNYSFNASRIYMGILQKTENTNP